MKGIGPFPGELFPKLHAVFLSFSARKRYLAGKTPSLRPFSMVIKIVLQKLLFHF